MKPFSNYNETQAFSERPALPAGGYVAKIKKAQVRTYSGQNGSFDKLEIAFDIAEGEYKDFFANDLKSQSGEDKKWKGVLRLYIPTDDGSDRDNTTKSIFKGNIEAVEDSNNGYHWDWEEKNLTGKTVGILFRNEEWEYDGKHGWKAQPFKFIAASKVREGKFTLPKDKPLKNSSVRPQTKAPAGYEEIVDDEDVPF